MTSGKRLLSDLTTDTPFPYTVKVRVTEKSRTQTSASETRYQNLILKDEQGHAMRATLYNQDIDAFDATIDEGREYEISNARIKKVNQRYRSRYTNMDDKHEITITHRTIVHQLPSTSHCPSHTYLSISEIPRAANPQERFDLLAVVIYVEPRRKTTGFEGTSRDVREIVIVDDSTNQMIRVSTWNDLAREESAALEDLTSSFPVIELGRLKTSSYKGFTFSTTPSTKFIIHPKGERAETLTKWRDSNFSLLSRRQTQVTAARKPPVETEIKSLHDIKQQQVDDTVQEEQHWLRILIQDFNPNKLIMYLSCTHCNANTKYEGATMTTCPSCSKHDSISVRRIILNFNAIDDKDTLPLVAHDVAAEKIIRLTATALYQMNNEDRRHYYETLPEILRTTPTYILLTPSILLSTNRVLQWVVKSAKSA